MSISAGDESPILRIEHLTVSLPPGADRPHAVEDLSLDLRRGELLCLVGESGSGKSVTAQAVLRLLPPELRVTQGAAWHEGRDLLTLSAQEMERLAGKQLSMVFQEPGITLNPVFRVGAQIEEALRIHSGLAAPERRARVMALLEEVLLPDPPRLANAFPHQLSGGQAQRVMIAMALALNPAVLVADEPTTALDVTSQAQILHLLKELQRIHNAGILFITHDFGVVAEIADRVAVMQHGHLVEVGTREEVLNHPRAAYTRQLIAAVPSLQPANRPAVPPGAAAVEVRNLVKRYRSGGSWLRRRREVLGADKVSLSVRKGETLGLVGESGSGKSTVAQCLVRLIPNDGGEILLDGEDIARLPERHLRPHRRHVQVVFQDPYAALNPRQRVGEAVAEGPRNFGLPLEQALARARELLRLVGLEESAAERFPHQFSGGQRQRICIARALALEPALLIADEPVSSLDVSVQAQILELLAEVQGRLGFAMLFITHDLRVAAQVCDRVAVMRAGRIVEEGPTPRLFTSPREPYTQELLAAVPGRTWNPA